MDEDVEKWYKGEQMKKRMTSLIPMVVMSCIDLAPISTIKKK